MIKRLLPCEYSVVLENKVSPTEWDAICVLDQQSIPDDWVQFTDQWLKLDDALHKESMLLVNPEKSIPLIYSPVGELTDFHDVRVYETAAAKAVERAIKAGRKRILMRLPVNPQFANAAVVAILGAYRELYVPLQMRERDVTKRERINRIGFYYHNRDLLETYTKTAELLFTGMFVAKDIGGSDPERMAPRNVMEYVKEVFPVDGPIKINVIEGHENFVRDFPLFAAVDRAANQVERHRGRIIFLEYVPPKTARKTIILVGKGVTYDTGGADVKAGGVMAGMSRDKCGAAAVAGFMKLIQETKPKSVRVIGVMCMVRNSIGEDCYVADELIKARSGVVVRIGNTDAEGRLAMADSLCLMKERCKEENYPDPHLFTVATLTGHAFMVHGEGYTIAMDNGPARAAKHAQRLQQNGEIIGDPVEISTVRTEDFSFHSGQVLGEDVMSANNLPSSRTPRGHQAPAAFLMMASGLDKHGLLSSHPMKYTHLDIAGSAGEYPVKPTGAPIRALYTTHIADSHGPSSELCFGAD